MLTPSKKSKRSLGLIGAGLAGDQGAFQMLTEDMSPADLRALVRGFSLVLAKELLAPMSGSGSGRALVTERILRPH